MTPTTQLSFDFACTDLVTWDFFYTTFRSKELLRGRTPEQYWGTRFYGYSMRLPANLSLAEALAAPAGQNPRPFGFGTSRSGVFQVQTERGVYLHRKGLRNLARCSASQILFYTWSDLEAAYESEDPILLSATAWLEENPGPGLPAFSRHANAVSAAA
ncbi:MAG: hypothetical protein HC927_06100 [Deltaproteobacteria bacterium]|nr:hypothetical protein [Deltaproteobacteria bacterium]